MKSIGYWENLAVGYSAERWESTCVTAVAVGVWVVVVSVLGREARASAVGQGIGEVTREVTDLDAVVFGRTVQ